MYIQVLILLISQVDSFKEIICNGTIVRDEYYEVQMLLKGFGKCYNLVMHELSGNLFFSHNCCSKKHFYLRIVSCHLGSGICTNVSGIAGGYAVYHYSEMDQVYFGGYDGIYQYDFTTKSAKFVGARNKIIWCIFVINNTLFYIDYPSFKLYSLQNKTEKLALGHKEYDYYFVSKHLDHYFANKAKELYKTRSSTRFDQIPILLGQKIKVRQITEDIYGNIYICAKDGIYVEDERSHRVKKIAQFQKIFGMTITNIYDIHKLPDSRRKKDFVIIYSNNNGIYKAYPSEYSQYCLLSIASGKQITRSLTNINSVSFSAKIDFD